MDCTIRVPILPKLPEFPGVRDGYRLAFDLRSKAFTCHSRVLAARRRCEPVRLPREQAGLEPSVQLEGVRSIWRTEPGGARSGSPRAPALTRVVDAVTGCSADRVHSAADGRPPLSLRVVPVPIA